MQFSMHFREACKKPWTINTTKTKTKKPLFYLDNIFNNLLIFNTVQTKEKKT